DDTADERELVGHLGDAGERLADLDAGDFRVDRLELAANLLRRFRLDVPHILVGRAAAEEDVDERLVAGAGEWVRLPGSLGPENVSKRQRGGTERECADFQEVPTADAVAEPHATGRNVQHTRTAPRKVREKAGQQAGNKPVNGRALGTLASV